MGQSKSERVVIVGAALGALFLATRTILYVRAVSPRGLIHDSAYLLFWLEFLWGGVCGALISWVLLKILCLKKGYALPGMSLFQGGCLGLVLAFVPFVIILNVLLPWSP